MNRRRPLLVVPLVGLLLLACLGSKPAREDAGDGQEKLLHWQWVHSVEVPAAGKLTDFIVPTAVFGKAQAGLADLRLTDPQGKPVPYDLRIRRPVNEQNPVPANSFDRVKHADRSASVSLDLGEKAVEHNEVEVMVPGEAYGRPLTVEGSNDRKKWSTLLDRRYLVNLNIAGRSVVENRFRYPNSRLRYVRVTVRPDRVQEGDAPTIDAARVFKSVQVPGLDTTGTATVLKREPVRHAGAAASAWRIDLGAENVPCAKLTLKIDNDDFSRPFILETWQTGGATGLVTQGVLRSARGRPIVIDLPSEVSGCCLRLTVVDHSNPALHIHKAEFTAPARQVVFMPPGPGPLKLYTGNPRAIEPKYDFAATLPAQLTPPPARTEVGTAKENPDYVPEPKPFTERWPYLVDAVLGGAALVLFAVLGILARSSIRRHDEAEGQGSVAPA